MGEFFRRLRYMLNRRRLDSELHDDMEFHREMAARDGRKNFGNTLRLREDAREAWGWTWVDRFLQDLRYAIRMFARSPGFTLTAVLVLAIGIGVNVSAFSLFNLVALKSLPIHDADSILRLQRRSPERMSSETPYANAIFYRDHSRTLSAIIIMMGLAPMELEEGGKPPRINLVSANFFTELGTSPAYGRLFDVQKDEAANAPPVVVLDHQYWQQHYGADPNIVGKTIRLNKKPATVVGVAPYAFSSLDGQDADVWLPIAQQPYYVQGSKLFTDTATGQVRMWGRLAPGATAKMAEQELLALTNELRKQYPKDIWKDEYIRSDPGGHLHVMEPEMFQAAALVGALTLLILAVACANLGGLLMARGVTREREMTIRLAIGASRKRIFRQLFTESLLLAMLGSVVGLALAYATLHIVLTQTGAPLWMNASPDWRVLLFAFAMALITSLFFGLAPALQIARQRQHKTLARQIVVAAQVAASCVLLIVASLLVRAAHHGLYANPGFGYEEVLSIDPGLGRHGYNPAAAEAYLDQLQSRLSGLSQVTSVSLVKLPPLGHTVTKVGTDIGGRHVDIYPNWVDAEFFRTMGIPVLLGRNFLPGEKNAVIVSASLAKEQWPGENPIGKQYWDKQTVVGVVGNARVNSLSEDDTVEMYQSAQLADMPDMVVIIKTAGAPDGLTPTLKAMVQNLDSSLFPEIVLLKASYRNHMQSIKMAAMIVSLIGMVAVMLAAVGIIGLVAFTVSQRMKEIAIRLALGAKHLQVLGAVLRQFRWPVVVGIAVGAVAAAGGSKILRRVLYGVSNLDPLSYVAAIFVVGVIVAVAALLPARKAFKADIARILHYE